MVLSLPCVAERQGARLGAVETLFGTITIVMRPLRQACLAQSFEAASEILRSPVVRMLHPVELHVGAWDELQKHLDLLLRQLGSTGLGIGHGKVL
jgi:hypothetical protein